MTASHRRTRQRTRTAAAAASAAPSSTAAIVSMVAWMLSSNVTPADCFAATSSTSTAFAASPASSSVAYSSSYSSSSSPSTYYDRTLRSSALHFREHSTPVQVEGLSVAFHHDASAPTSEAPSLDSIVSVHNSPLEDDHHYNQLVDDGDIDDDEDMLPTWLSLPRSHLAEHNMERLGNAMRSSFFTQTEVLKLQNAVQEAAEGDLEKIAGAADFLLILVETMEMGYNALVAAAFHYCACVLARERHESTLLEHAQTDSFGEHVAGIIRDAARLKQLENVAAAVMDLEGVARVSPDSHDAENIRNLLLSETNDWRALAIRSAACLYRLRGLLQSEALTGDAQLTRESARVAREALHIYSPLASRLGMNRLKNELEGAAFRILYRRQYEKVKNLTQEPCKSNDSTIGQSMRRVLDQVKGDMTAMLQEHEEFSSYVDNLEVTARVKESYSMWRKMLRNGHKRILDVPDALALRIVFDAKPLSEDEPREVTRARERALCYYAQQLCTERWRPMEGNPRFKDYIESPKANGYQSLHYTAETSYAGDDWSLEIQVRSSEMHQVAEFGLASHWDYKAQKKTARSSSAAASSPSSSSSPPESRHEEFDRSSAAYLHEVKQWHWQQHAGASSPEAQRKAAFVTASLNDASPASVEPVVFSDIWQSRVRADRIRARTQRLEPYIQALTAAQSDLARDYVFVFLKQHDESDTNQSAEGKVLALPAGACVIDALREGERSLGVPLLVGDVFDLNGVATSVTNRLSNGDVLTVPLQTQVTMSY